MNLNQVTLPATDLERSVAFYCALGFNLIVSELPRYARFECPVGGSTFSLDHVADAPQGAAVVVYSELTARGIEFEGPPTEQPWLWREAYLYDPDRNLLCLYHAGENRRNPPWRIRSGAQTGAVQLPHRAPRGR